MKAVLDLEIGVELKDGTPPNTPRTRGVMNNEGIMKGREVLF